jgi:hypothetical protein
MDFWISPELEQWPKHVDDAPDVGGFDEVCDDEASEEVYADLYRYSSIPPYFACEPLKSTAIFSQGS